MAASAVVVQFGSQALGLARSPLAPDPDAALAATDDADESLQANVFGLNETNASRFDALDSDARHARLLTPGTNEPEAGLSEPPAPPESGFFRTSAGRGSESLLASDGLDDGLDWLFPGSASSQALDPAFAGPDAEFRSAEATPAAAVAPASGLETWETSAELQRETQNLERNARQVRADERAQRAALTGYASGVQLRYELGPDGRRYLVEAEVPLEVKPVPGDPAATLQKMEAIRRAASAAGPSGSARDAAAEATQLAVRARAQLAADRYTDGQKL